MALDHKPLDQLTEADLLDLVANAVAEGTTLDYKQELPTNQDESKKEFLRDATSFANTAGGHLVFGMTEDGGIPTGVPGIALENVEEKKLWLENILRDGIDPRLPQWSIQEVPVTGGQFVIVIRFPRSWQRPHMVTFRNDSRFFARHSTGKYQLDVAQIRSSVLSSPTATDRIREFRKERTDAVTVGLVPAPLLGQPKILLHLIPLDAVYEGNVPLDIGQAMDDSRLQPIYTDHPWPMRWNIDGLYTDDHEGVHPAWGFVQLYRTGIIEAVDAGLLSAGQEPQGILGHPFEKRIISATKRYTAVQKDIGVSLPVVVFVTLISVGGLWIVTPDVARNREREQRRIDREVVVLPDVMLQSWDDEIGRLLRPVFDGFWQAGGLPGSPNYDDDGNWIDQD
jgi:Schlafen, AlbA_2